MYGRYGVDSLYYGLFLLYIILFVIQLIERTVVVSVLMTLTLVYMVFRVMSRNHYARQKENGVYLKVTRPVKAFFTTNFRRVRDIRSKRYRTCKKCKAVVRLPIKKGTHNVKCPKCGNNFKVKIIF